MTSDTRRWSSTAAAIIRPLLLLAWAAGTPVLAWGAIITATPFFGETPTAEEMAQAQRLAAAAAACAYVAPVLGLVMAARARIRGLVWVFAAALAISVGALVLLLSR